MARSNSKPLTRYGNSWKMTMADKKTMQAMFGLLRANWPKYPFTKMTIQVYTRCLGDIPDDILVAATAHCLTSCTFFPVVAELRQAAFDIMCNKTGQLTAGEAWALVVKTANVPESWWAAGERHERPKLPESVQKALDAIGGWRRLTDSDHYSADRARFLEAYDAFAKRDIEIRQMLPEVRALTQRLTMDRKPLGAKFMLDI